MGPTKTYRRSCADWMSQYPWEVVADLTFRYSRVSEETAQKMFIEWCRKIVKNNGVRIACQGVLNFDAGNPHIHILMLARSKKTGKTLLDLNLNSLADQWPARAWVKPIREAKAASPYVFINNTKGMHLPLDYGTNLLIDLDRGKF